MKITKYLCLTRNHQIHVYWLSSYPRDASDHWSLLLSSLADLTALEITIVQYNLSLLLTPIFVNMYVPVIPDRYSFCIGILISVYNSI